MVVFAGRSKCGKTTLAKRFAGEHDLQRVTFSDVVRRVAGEKLEATHQTVQLLQDVGAKLVSDDPARFCRETCRDVAFSSGQCVVLDGLRHKSLLPYLRALHTDLTVLVVYVEASEKVRMARFAPPVTAEALHEIDDHLVEREEDSLRAVADLILTTDCSEVKSYDQLSHWFENNKYCQLKATKPDELRVPRLFFRAWIVASVFWMLSAAVYMHSADGKMWELVRATERSSYHRLSKGHLLPLDCKGLKGAEALDYFHYEGHCWMPIETYRRLYPEVQKTTDSVLLSESYKSGSMPVEEERLASVVKRVLRALLLVPLCLLCIGIAFYWVSKGTFGNLLKGGVLRGMRLALWERNRTLK